MKENYKLIISYDGSRYFGFEKQKDQEATIQGKIEGVLSRMPRNDASEPELIGASRTDAGVHARGMCANVFLDTDLSEEEIQDYGNQYLPEDIAILSVKKVSPRFHARYNALGKIYRYSCYIGRTKPVFDGKFYCIWKKNRISEPWKRLPGILSESWIISPFAEIQR